MSRLLRRVASIGAGPDADPDELLRSRTLVLAALLIVVLSFVWVFTYAWFELWIPAAIPFTYQVVTAIALTVYARTERIAPFRDLELAMILILPFTLQWSLGGFIASSAVSLWALIAPLGALMLVGVRRAGPWFAVYLGLLAASWAFDPTLSRDPDLPAGVQLAFFALNVAGVSLTVYLILRYFVRERERAMDALDREHRRSERLLLNVLPASIAARLKDEESVADRFDEATVLFADVVGFTPLAVSLPPERVVGILDEVFSAFDDLAQERGLEKIKTIGDAYMVAGGVPDPRPDHVEAVADMAMAMLHHVGEAGNAPSGLAIHLRIGMDSGPVVAGVIGRNRFIYDVWGDTVNTASRMQSHGLPDRIQVTPGVVRALGDRFEFEPRGPVDVKGKGPIEASLLVGRKDGSDPGPSLQV